MKMSSATLKKLGLPAPSKYGNKRTACLLKHLHDSKAEATYCNSLLADLQAKRIAAFTVQFCFSVGPNINHIVDFLIRRLDGSQEVHDVKGMATAAWRMKYKLFCSVYPNIKYVVVKR